MPGTGMDSISEGELSNSVVGNGGKAQVMPVVGSPDKSGREVTVEESDFPGIGKLSSGIARRAVGLGSKKDKANISMLRKLEESTGHDAADNITKDTRRRTAIKINKARAADPIKHQLSAFHTERPEDLTKIDDEEDFDEEESYSDENDEGEHDAEVGKLKSTIGKSSPQKNKDSAAEEVEGSGFLSKFTEVIHPDSFFINAWMIFGILAICFCIFVGPLRVAFVVQNDGVFLKDPFMQFIYVLLEVYFLVNTMNIEFRKGYYDEHTMDLMMEKDIIRDNYMHMRRFGMECILSFPFDIVNITAFGCANETLTGLSLLKLFR